MADWIPKRFKKQFQYSFETLTVALLQLVDDINRALDDLWASIQQDVADLQAQINATNLAKVNRSGDTMTGDLTIDKPYPSLNFIYPAGYDVEITSKRAGIARWRLLFGYDVGGTEVGGNTGSDVYLQAYSDAGAFLRNNIHVRRSDGLVEFSNAVTATSFGLDAQAYWTVSAGVVAFSFDANDYITYGRVADKGSIVQNSYAVFRWGAVPLTEADHSQSSTGISLANGGVATLEAGSGLLILNSFTTGSCALFIMGGGVTALFGATVGGFVAGVPAAGQIGVYYNGAGSYVIHNNTGSAVGLGKIWLRTRPSA